MMHNPNSEWWHGGHRIIWQNDHYMMVRVPYTNWQCGFWLCGLFKNRNSFLPVIFKRPLPMTP
jgi:hypothetical protein